MSTITTVMRRATNYDDPGSLGSRLRARRSELLVRELAAIHAEKGHVDVIDIGGTRSYWNAIQGDVLTRYDVTVTVVNLPGEPHPEDDDRFRFREGNGCDLQDVADLQFDLAHANSVLEHVGRWPEMRAFAAEVRRVARGYVVQTPYFWFPVEPHFMAPVFHWLPESSRARLLQRLPLGHSGRAESLDVALSRVQSATLVDATMFRALFPDAQVQFERLAGLPKSLIGIRSATGPSAPRP
ncbi:class I SAM-dependent methyltransferase [Lapillicoccus jejuensis]|uniref:Methyltransferase family protein n=1 Tax=Lapillicoccus jejuensis TaxID=402171 RepID=A0A542E1T0_9MICO|nr:class I SAM-dependent methyltransferase [Lapillicoccus jejuensis]TQJ09174.1 methyltransferase family protein [Lapillicoccus jejuensis]